MKKLITITITLLLIALSAPSCSKQKKINKDLEKITCEGGTYVLLSVGTIVPITPFNITFTKQEKKDQDGVMTNTLNAFAPTFKIIEDNHMIINGNTDSPYEYKIQGDVLTLKQWRGDKETYQKK